MPAIPATKAIPRFFIPLPRLPEKQINLAVMFLAVVILSTAGILIRISEDQGLGPGATIFCRFLISFVALSFWVGKQELQAHRHSLSLLIGASTSFWACQVFWSASLLMTGVGNSSTLHNAVPIFAVVVALLSGRRVSFQYLSGAGVAILGAIWITAVDWEAGHMLGDGLALLSALFLAIYIVMLEKLRHRGASTVEILYWVCGIVALLSLPIAWIEGQVFPGTVQGWAAVIGLAFGCQLIGQFLQTYSLQMLSATVVSVMLLLDPVFAAGLAWGAFGEPTSLVGMATVLVGVYLASED